jgi:hypothetical protein
MSTDQTHIGADFYYRIPMQAGEDKPSFGKNPIDPAIVRHEPHQKSVANARNIHTTLDNEGFVLARHESSIRNFYDKDEVEKIYYPEMKTLAKQVTGAKSFRVLGHITRNEADVSEGKGLGAHRLVHSDFTPALTHRIREFGPNPELAKGRLAIFNIWRRFDVGHTDAPLAVCDRRSISPEDLIPTDLHNYGGSNGFELEIYQALHSDQHRWFYYPEMKINEVMIFKTLDSEMDPFVPTLHSAFDHPNCPEDSPSRESIETRVLCFY